MVVYENTVETLLLAELCTLDDALEGFIGREEDSAAELGSSLHISAHRATTDRCRSSMEEDAETSIIN
jgi:hypothetical protein